MRTAREMLQAIKAGHRPSREELEWVASQFCDPLTRQDRYTLLHVLGLGGPDERHRAILEEAMRSGQAPMLARLALQSLCRYWGEGARYKKDLVTFVRGVDWDEDAEVRLAALAAAGELVRESHDRELTTLLLEMFDDSDLPTIIRESAYLALGRGVGKEWSELPSSARHFDLVRDVSEDVLQRARQITAR